ncbi:MAG: DUF2283 domain-containing protein [bacterium]|nr:DUF2283 domain-containing protein [bacterium]
MKIQYDKAADALYITLGVDDGSRGVVQRTERINGSPIALDYDAEGKIFGIEVFEVSSCSPSQFQDDFLLQYASK